MVTLLKILCLLCFFAAFMLLKQSRAGGEAGEAGLCTKRLVYEIRPIIKTSCKSCLIL